MSSSEKKNKRNGVVGTIIFHLLLLVAFLFMGLTYSIPPPPEEGISINFGFSDQGFEEVQPEEDSKESNPIIEEVVQDVIEVEQEIITQETIETEVIEVPKEIKKEKVEEKKPEEKQEEIIVKPVEPVINKKALYIFIREQIDVKTPKITKIAKIAQIRAEEKLNIGQKLSYCESYDELQGITTLQLSKLANIGDADALEVFEISAKKLGYGLSVIIDILTLFSIICIGTFQNN